MKDYYQLLGLNRQATELDIKRAYRNRALQLHPDRSGNDGTRKQFIAVTEAFQVLSKPEKRQAYDKQFDQPGLAENYSLSP